MVEVEVGFLTPQAPFGMTFFWVSIEGARLRKGA
jgi:hypothetical protein